MGWLADMVPRGECVKPNDLLYIRGTVDEIQESLRDITKELVHLRMGVDHLNGVPCRHGFDPIRGGPFVSYFDSEVCNFCPVCGAAKP